MKIVIASDSFKGSLSSMEVADAVEAGILKSMPDAEIIKLPVADGGEGTVETLVSGTGGRYVDTDVTGPSGDRIRAGFGILSGDEAVIEMAAASGLTLVKDGKLDPLTSTTFGTGELMIKALEMGCKELYIGIGGSATNDGGVGMAQALGVTFRDSEGKELAFGGGAIGALETIDISNLSQLLKGAKIIVMSDVTNPLCGERGASYVYGPQKGASPEMVKLLDRNLRKLADKIKDQLGIDIKDMPGSGAAGGLGAGLVAFCNGKLEPGIQRILDILDFENKLEGADLLITGEGRIDFQSAYGKVVSGIANIASAKGVSVIAIAGSLGEGYEALYSTGVSLILPIVDKPMTLDEAMKDAKRLVTDTGERIGRILKI